MARLAAPFATLAGAGLFALSIFLRGPLGECNAIRRQELFRYTPERRIAPLLAGAHRSAAADVLWLQALPDLSRTFADRAAKQRWLDGVLEVITDLEPGFRTVYSYGASYLSMIAEDPDRSLALLQKGVRENQDSYRLAVELANAHLMLFDDRRAALEILEGVVEHPACDSFTLATYTSLLVDEDADVAAVMQWSGHLDHSNEEVRAAAELGLERTLRRIGVRAFREYETEHGRPPSPEDLRAAGLMAAEVTDAVLGAMRFLEDGKLAFPRLERLELRRKLAAAQKWCLVFRHEHGRWPDREEVLDNEVVPLPALRAGLRYVVEDGEVSVEEDSQAGAAEVDQAPSPLPR